jgi:hypothetical protein
MSTPLLLIQPKRNAPPAGLICEVTAFHGGQRDRECVQITLDYSHVQLTAGEVRQLRDCLSLWLGDI